MAEHTAPSSGALHEADSSKQATARTQGKNRRTGSWLRVRMDSGDIGSRVDIVSNIETVSRISSLFNNSTATSAKCLVGMIINTHRNHSSFCIGSAFTPRIVLVQCHLWVC